MKRHPGPSEAFHKAGGYLGATASTEIDVVHEGTERDLDGVGGVDDARLCGA